MNARTKETPMAPREAVFGQLEKVLASRLFQGAERSTKLLRFLVEQTLNGKTDHLKEYTLGTEALGRGSSFDPRTDPIVRAEASRLRTRLDKYYATDGAADTLVIVLPKGSYVLQFECRNFPAAKAPAPERQEQSSSKRAGMLAFGFALAACVLIVVLWSFWRAPRTEGAISLAVLPFANMSGDASQEFFSDGMTEEITSALAKVRDLRVVGRTSAFQFKGQNQDLRSIGQQLHATHLIEGSVRKAGDRVRITVQLIRVDDGTHVWTEDYDRNLTDIFAIQEGVAQAIAASLRVPLGLSAGQNLVNNRRIDPETYQQYLRANALINGRGGNNTRLFPRGRADLPEAASLLEQVVAKYPDYAPAWSRLASDYLLIGNTDASDDNAPAAEVRRRLAEFRNKAEAAAQRAVQLDPDFSDGYRALGSLAGSLGHALEADEYYKKALSLDPNNSDLLFAYSMRLAIAGRLAEALAMTQLAHSLEPFQPLISQQTVAILWVSGKNEEAIALAKSLGAPAGQIDLAWVYTFTGRYREAADVLTELAAGDLNSDAARAAQILRTPPRAASSVRPPPYGFIDAYLGKPERLVDVYKRRVDVNNFAGYGLASVWHPAFAAVRKLNEFKNYLRVSGLVAYWRAKGWPEFCHPTTGEDFECN